MQEKEGRQKQLGILLSLSKIARAHFLNLIFFSSNNENMYFVRWPRRDSTKTVFIFLYFLIFVFFDFCIF